jgi:hypothetical protein
VRVNQTHSIVWSQPMSNRSPHLRKQHPAETPVIYNQIKEGLVGTGVAKKVGLESWLRAPETILYVNS